MWIADNWKDYEVIDCSKGEKLERWGEYLLVRPDPQVIWDTEKTLRGWKRMNGHYHRSKKGGGEWEFFDLPKQWQIHYRDLTFNLKPFSFKHTGLFPCTGRPYLYACHGAEAMERPRRFSGNRTSGHTFRSCTPLRSFRTVGSTLRGCLLFVTQSQKLKNNCCILFKEIVILNNNK